jgi:hypothetical protein
MAWRSRNEIVMQTTECIENYVWFSLEHLDRHVVSITGKYLLDI